MKFKIRTILLWAIIGFLLISSTLIHAVCDWFNIRFGVSFEEILFTITSPLNGSDISFMSEVIEYVLPFIIDTLLLFAVLLLLLIVLSFFINIQLDVIIGKLKCCVNFSKIYQTICLISVLATLCSSISYGVQSLHLGEYIARKMDDTTIYEDYYINPNEITITNNGNTKNIIYIYLESMETTYASTSVGGYQETNYIPHLTELAETNVSFSHNDALGGANITSGASWTMGALFSSTTGVPFSLPVDGNSMNTFKNFAPGITALGDILEEQGYNQVFLCGSDGNFGGRRNYFEQHGNYDVFDYYDMIDSGYIDENYYVWWGVEDYKLYDIAKTELLKLAKTNAPFNFTMLTVDTHHVDGYVCDNCSSTYDSQLPNVLECADNQIYNFINWCKQQDFYDDTVIVITGDHFRMDSTLVDKASAESGRRVYNCYINSSKEPVGSTKNRIFTSLDFFPTTLSAMGFEISGNRLGLGTDLFSGEKTLAEELGFDAFNAELGKYSKYYEVNFE